MVPQQTPDGMRYQYLVSTIHLAPAYTGQGRLLMFVDKEYISSIVKLNLANNSVYQEIVHSMTSYLLRPNTTQINGFMAEDTHNRESTIGGGTASPNCGSTHHTNTEVGYSNKLISITRFTNTQPPMYT